MLIDQAKVSIPAAAERMPKYFDRQMFHSEEPSVEYEKYDKWEEDLIFSSIPRIGMHKTFCVYFYDFEVVVL